MHFQGCFLKPKLHQSHQSYMYTPFALVDLSAGKMVKTCKKKHVLYWEKDGEPPAALGKHARLEITPNID